LLVARDARSISHMFFTLWEQADMCIERVVRNLGFALAALSIVTALAASIEYLPVVNALAH